MSALYFDARIDGAQLQKDIANINRQLSGMTGNFENEGKKIDDITRRMATGLAAYFSVFTATNFVKDIARVRGEFQQLEVAFETMLDSKAKADILMSQIVEFAAITPFQLTDLATGTKQLLAIGTAAEDIIPTMKALGDVSAGLSVPIERLILNYGQVRTQLKLTGRELRDFNIAGVPLVSELAKNLDVAEDKIAGMVEKGEIGFKDVEAAFFSMTAEGGRFNDLMDKQAKTITGLASNFADAWDRMLNSIGKENEGIIANTIKGATTLVENYEEVIKILKILVVTYGTYKAAVIVTNAIQSSAALLGNVRAWLQLASGIRTAKDAQIAFNLATKANPYGIILAAVTALITALTLYNRKTDESARISAEFSKNLNDEKKAIDDAFKSITNAKEGTKERSEAIQAVNDKYREYLPNLLTEASNLKEIESAQRNVTKAMAENLAFKAQGDQLATVQKDYEDSLKSFYSQIDSASKKLTNEQKGQFKAVMEQYEQELKAQFEQFGYFPEFVINRIGDKFRELTGDDLGGFALSGLELSIKDLIRSESELETQTDSLKTTYDSYLKALGINEAPPEPATLKTINEQIETTKTLLDEAKKKLAELRSPDSTATVDDIKKQEQVVKGFEDSLTTLTGVSKKITTQIQKDAPARIKAIQDYAQAELDIQNSLEQSKLSVMKDGAAKRREQAKRQYELQLQDIEQQGVDYLEKLNAAKGLKATDEGYITTLPADVQANLEQQRLNAGQQYANQLVEINKSAASEIKSFWNDVTSVFMSNLEREKLAINTRYDEQVEKAREAGANIYQISLINAARMKELEGVDNEYAIQLSEFFKEAYGNIEKYGYETLKRLQEQTRQVLDSAQYETQGEQTFVLVDIPAIDAEGKAIKKQVKLTIDEFTRLQNQYNQFYNAVQKKNPFSAIKSGFQDLTQAFKKGDKDAISNAVEGLNSSFADGLSMLQSWADSFEKIFGKSELVDQIMEVTEGVGQLGVGIAQMYSGDVLGGLTNAFKGIATLIDVFRGKSKAQLDTEELQKLSEKTKDIYDAINKQLERRVELIKDATAAEASYLDTLTQESVDKFEEYYRNMFEGLRDNELFGKKGKNNDLDLEDVMDMYGLNSIVEFIDWWNNGGYADLLLDDFTITNEDLWNSLIDGWNNLQETSENSAEAMEEAVTGISFDSLKDSLDDLLTSVDTTMEDISESFEGHMEQAILNFVKSNYLNDALRQWYDQFTQYAGDGTLSAEEVANLEGIYQQIYENAQGMFDAAASAAGIDITDTAAYEELQGIARGLTEETGSLIVGQFSSMREYQKNLYLTAEQQLDMMNQSVAILAEIAENTSHNKRLIDIETNTAETNRILKEKL